MDDINFISDNSGKKRRKDKGGSGDIKWTKPPVLKKEPEKEVKNIFKKEENEKFSSSLFSFFKKIKQSFFIKPKNKHTIVLPVKKETIIANEALNNLKQEISQLTKEPVKINENKKLLSKKSFFSFLADGLPNKKNKNELSIDYKESLKSEAVPEKKEKPRKEIRHKEVEQKEAIKKSLADFEQPEKKWESSNILETNLIEGETVLLRQLKKDLLVLFIFISLAVVFVLAAYKGFVAWGDKKNIQVVASAEKINNLNSEIYKLEEELKDAPKLGDELKIVEKLLDNHVYWSNFFNFLEENTLSNVSYSNFSFGGEKSSNEYSFLATADSFKTLVSQVNFLRLSEYVESAEATGGRVAAKEAVQATPKEELGKKEGAEQVKEESKVEFELKMSIKPIVFSKGPQISKIEPAIGVKGDYVTLHGINFRPFREGKSSVKFYNPSSGETVEAGVDFPSECKGKWWHNSFIVIKVPDIKEGVWQIVITNEEGEILSPINFMVARGKPSPGVCLINPSYGFEDQSVNIYGDNFGDSQGEGKVYLGDMSVKTFKWSNNEITAEFPIKAGSGSVKIKPSSGEGGNNLEYKQLN